MSSIADLEPSGRSSDPRSWSEALSVVPMDAGTLAVGSSFFTFDRAEEERAMMGATVAADPERRAAIAAKLGVS